MVKGKDLFTGKEDSMHGKLTLGKSGGSLQELRGCTTEELCAPVKTKMESKVGGGGQE